MKRIKPASNVKLNGARTGARLFPSKDAHRVYSGHMVMARMAAQPRAGRKSPPTQIARPTSTIVNDVRAIIRARELKGSGSRRSQEAGSELRADNFVGLVIYAHTIRWPPHRALRTSRHRSRRWRRRTRPTARRPHSSQIPRL